MFKMYLLPKEVWAFITKNEERLTKESILVAEDGEFTDIFLTIDKDVPRIFVDYSGEEISSEEITSERDCRETVENMYRRYLLIPQEAMDNGVTEGCETLYDPNAPDEKDLTPEEEEQALMDEIYEREDELFLATAEFLGVALGVDENMDLIKAIHSYNVDIGKFLDSALECLAVDHNVSVYRPTMVPDPDNEAEEILEEYPYDYLTEPSEENHPAEDADKDDLK